MKPVVPKSQRCAIYTRKSTEHNLDLEFNPIPDMREIAATKAYTIGRRAVAACAHILIGPPMVDRRLPKHASYLARLAKVPLRESGRRVREKIVLE